MIPFLLNIQNQKIYRDRKHIGNCQELVVERHRGGCLMSTRLPLGPWKYLGEDGSSWRLHSTENVLSATKWCALRWFILCCVNFTSFWKYISQWKRLFIEELGELREAKIEQQRGFSSSEGTQRDMGGVLRAGDVLLSKSPPLQVCYWGRGLVSSLEEGRLG